MPTRHSVLAEGKHVSRNIGVEERDLEGVLGDGTLLTDELIEPLFDNRAVAIRIHVTPLRRSRRVAIEQHVESYGGSRDCWAHDDIEVTSVKAVGELPVGRVEPGGLLLNRPVARQSPVIEPQLRRDGVRAGLVR